MNADDPDADVFAAATLDAGATLLRYGVAAAADVRASDIAVTDDGLVATVTTPRGSGTLRLPLLGRFNVHNALAVVALGELLELDAALVLAGLAGFRGVRGRMERIDRGQPFTLIVDYAHTPASLAAVLDDLAGLVGPGGGRIAVFGSAGERDVAKRALQGRVAGERCRLVIATDEDPRGEEPMAILEQIAEGAEAAGPAARRRPAPDPGPAGGHHGGDRAGAARRRRPPRGQGPRAEHHLRGVGAGVGRAARCRGMPGRRGLRMTPRSA